MLGAWVAVALIAGFMLAIVVSLFIFPSIRGSRVLAHHGPPHASLGHRGSGLSASIGGLNRCGITHRIFLSYGFFKVPAVEVRCPELPIFGCFQPFVEYPKANLC